MNFENFLRDGKITFEGKEHAFHFENNILTIFSNDIENDWSNYSSIFFRTKILALKKIHILELLYKETQSLL